MRSSLGACVFGGVVALAGAVSSAQFSPSLSGTFYNSGNVGIGVTFPRYPLDVQTMGARGIFVDIPNSSGVRTPLWGQTSATGGRAVLGVTTSSTGVNFGLYGRSVSNQGRGVFGEALATTGTTFGVLGIANSAGGSGVAGVANRGAAVKGVTQTGVAVFGNATNPLGWASQFYGTRNYFEGQVGIGTMSPTTMLDVRGGAYVQGNSAFGTASTAMYPVSINTADDAMGMVHTSTASGTAIATSVSASTAAIGTTGAAGLQLFTNMNAWVEISADGRFAFATAPRSNNSFLIQGTNQDDFVLRTESASQTALFTVDDGGNCRATSYQLSSDARMKTGVRGIESALETVLDLRGVTFEWREGEPGFGSGRQVGLIAQEVERVLPEVVSEGPEGYKSVAYANLVALLIEATRAQQTAIEAAAGESAALREENRVLREMVERLAARVGALEGE